MLIIPPNIDCVILLLHNSKQAYCFIKFVVKFSLNSEHLSTCELRLVRANVTLLVEGHVIGCEDCKE